MTIFRKTETVVLVITGIAVLGVAGVWLSRPTQAMPGRQSANISTVTEPGLIVAPSLQAPSTITVLHTTAPTPLSPNITDGSTSNTQIPLPSEPAELAGFWHATAAEQHRLLQAVAGTTPLPREVVAFCLQALGQRRLSPTTRNHLATLVGAQRPLPVGFLAQLETQAGDECEDLVWRDYAVQHIAVAARVVDDPEPVVAWLWSVAKRGQGSQRGTALLHASRLARDLRVPLASDASDVTTAMALGSHETIDSRIAALAVIGEQRLRDRMPEVFALTRGETDPALIAAALACAGLIGEPSGENWITDFVHHPHPMVRAAAEAAIARLQGHANGATP